MKFIDFKRKMSKDVFSASEAQLVAYPEPPALLNLQLHQWEGQGTVIRLKRGIYYFAERNPAIGDVAKALYFPCYFSLEYVLSSFGILPEAAYAYTLVTTKATRRWQTPLGLFIFRTIQPEAFIGYDPSTLMAEKEKALVDYFYLNRSRLEASPAFWESSRLEAGATGINFKKVFRYATLFSSGKLRKLLESLASHAKSEEVD